MVEKVGRNDLCPCGSGKKYKSCCLQKAQQKRSPLGGRKFTAKIINAGGTYKSQPQQNQEEKSTKPVVDYTVLMERSFGEALHAYEEKPPILLNPSEYLVQDETNEDSKN